MRSTLKAILQLRSHFQTESNYIIQKQNNTFEMESCKLQVALDSNLGFLLLQLNLDFGEFGPQLLIGCLQCCHGVRPLPFAPPTGGSLGHVGWYSTGHAPFRDDLSLWTVKIGFRLFLSYIFPPTCSSQANKDLKSSLRCRKITVCLFH